MNPDTDGVPFVAIGEEELGGPLGKTVRCERCGKRHAVENSNGGKRWSYATSGWIDVQAGLLQFYKCGEGLFLVGINGREIKYEL